MSMRIASAEIVSVFFMLIILLSLRTNTEKKSVSNRVFLALTVSATVGLISDALSYITEEYRGNEFIQAVINVLAFATIDICIALFSFYLILLIRRKVNVSYRPVYPAVAISALNILLIILGTFNGRFFIVKDHHFVYGPWSDFLIVMPVFGMIAVLVVMIFYSKNLGKRNTVVLASFVFFPVISAVILIFIPKYGLGYLATALSCAVVYTFIRRTEIDEANNREQIIKEVISLDTLTGLLNRRGFNEAVEQASGHEALGVVFCDLNALKYTNDQFGHEAGDAYILRFADLLRRIFDNLGPICRISGDEFVVLLYDISEDQFGSLKEQLNCAIRENDRLASVGYAYGNHEKAMKLVRYAEQEMYEDKSRYYAETGMDRRRENANTVIPKR